MILLSLPLGKGAVVKQILIDGIIFEIRFHDIYLSPGIHYKLISLGTIEEQWYSIEALNGHMKVIESPGDDEGLGHRIA